jgi:tRNA-specific 2-thiouridylase
MEIKKKKVFVGASGGVDSSTAMAILNEQGYDVTGVFIKVWQPDFVECQWKEDRLDAMRVCATLGVQFLDLDLEEEYKKGVFNYMVDGYKNGRTPNPDVMCNKKIKFGAFLDFALENGADYVAMGHYVRFEDGKLLAGVDKNKDQSYFLWTLTVEQLKYCLFPIGDYEKTKVREMAKKFKLSTAQKKDSQGLCFVGKVNMKEFLKRFIPQKKGEVLNKEGEVIGEHDGVFYYTLGQRHGFLIIKKGTDDKPYYIVKKDLEKNELVVSNIVGGNFSDKSSENQLFEVEVGEVNWIAGEMPDLSKQYKARVRYRQILQDCRLIEKAGKFVVEFDVFQNVDRGQSIVFYDGEICLGGGVVK